MTGATTLSAKWSTNYVWILYSRNGGSASAYDGEWIKYNGSIYFHSLYYANSTDPYNASTLGLSRSGYNFGGWKVQSTGSVLGQDTSYGYGTYSQYNNSGITVANSSGFQCRMHAVWNVITYTITLYNQNGSITTKYVNHGSTFSNSPSGRSSNGHSLTFTGYWTGKNCTGTHITWGTNASGAVYGSATYYGGWLSCWPSGWATSTMSSRMNCGGYGKIQQANTSARSIYGVTTSTISSSSYTVYTGKWYVIPYNGN